MWGNSDFVRIPAEAWGSHEIHVHLNSGDSITNGVHRVHHQTYLRTKRQKENTHYDVCLNRAQLREIWEALPLKLDDGSGA
jgi:hypothetical protein